MTRIQLFAAVAALVHRNDLADFFDVALQMGESKIAQKLRANEMLILNGTIDTTVAEVGPAQWPLPSDFLEEFDIIDTRDGRRRSLDSWTRDQIADFSRSVGRGPAGYSITGKTIELRPIPSGTVLDLMYFARLDPLVDDVDTNEVLVNYPEVYIFATMIGVFTWTQDADNKADAMAEFTTAVDNVNNFAQAQRTGRNPAQYTGRAYVRRSHARNI